MSEMTRADPGARLGEGVFLTRKAGSFRESTMAMLKETRIFILCLMLLSGCVNGTMETPARTKAPELAVPGFSGIVYGLKNRSHQGEIVATLLYADGRTRYAGTVGISCNGQARSLLGDSQVNPGKIYLYSVCHRTGVINGLVVPRRSQPNSRFFLSGTYLGSWNAGWYVHPPDDMALTPDGRFLYVGGERGSLIGFRVQRSGRLETISHPVHPPVPARTRILSLGVSADGEDLVVSEMVNQGFFLRQYRIDRNTGQLEDPGQAIKTPGPVRGLVPPDSLSNGNILAGVVRRKNHPSSFVVFRGGEGFGRNPPTVRTLSPADGRIRQILFGPSGHSLYVMSEAPVPCSGMHGKIRRYSVGEYGASLRPGPFVCGKTGGGFHNATWDPSDRLLITRSVIRIPDEPGLSPRLLSGRVAGDHGLVFVPANGEALPK
ncbi:MAG: hypothetical protein ACYCRD_10125 [Leptospirillum sp.]